MRLLLALARGRGTPEGVACAVLIACAILALGRYGHRLGYGARRLADTLAWSALIVVAGLTVLDAAANVRSPRPWDFPAFYAAAHAAAHGLHFYDPRVLTAVQHQVHAGSGVPDEWLVEVGYWYLPPSMLLLLPLGFFPFRLALALHLLIQGGFLLGSAWLLHRMTPIARGPFGGAMMVLLLLLFRPVQSAEELAQIVFGALFFLLLAARLLPRSSAAAGVSLAVGFLFKHVLMIPAALLTLSADRRHRNAGLAAIAGIAVALGASALVFGPGIFGEWAANGPGARAPTLAVDPVVQSLLALLYRALGDTPAGSLTAVIAYPPFALAAAGLTLATLVIASRAPASRHAECFWLVACLALILYPNTLFNTLALLFPIVLIILQHALRRGASPGIAIGFVGGVYAIAGWWPVGAGWLCVICWGVLAIQLLDPVGADTTMSHPALVETA